MDSGGRAYVRVAVLLVIVAVTTRIAHGQSDAARPMSGPVKAPFPTTGSLAHEMQLDPARMHAPLVPRRATLEDTSNFPPGFREFYQLLLLHNKRFGEDDNFTLRIIDNDSGKLLERYVLTDERAVFLARGSADWDKVDRRRRAVMTTLLNKWEKRGHKRSDMTVTWGRLNQVFEARRRAEPFLAYELRLAHMHRLSALSTELSTVETFNQDWLVSRAGARGRYQFMPEFTRRFGLHRFRIRSTTGAIYWVREERHPLLTMEYAFMIMRAYSNTVGHELPGLSAYNTGVGNIFNICRLYLMRERPDPDSATVFDAYSWAVTTGFKEVRRHTTFRRQSRAYLPSVVAAYRAVEQLPVDLSRTMHAELVTMRRGQTITLGELLETLKTHDLDWTPYGSSSIYESFRAFNSHLDLPPASSTGKIPTSANLKLTNPSRTLKLRFFLPLGSSAILKKAGKNVFDEDELRVFDDNTFADPEKTHQKSMLDWEYERIVNEIGHFGFTMEMRDRVSKIAEKMEKLAEQKPTPYRRAQAEIARMHAHLWSYGPWLKLEQAVAQTRNMHHEQLRQGAPPPSEESSDDAP
jgi:hypothetical protein